MISILGLTNSVCLCVMGVFFLFAIALETECGAKQSVSIVLQIQANNCPCPVISREKPQKNEQQLT